MEPDLALLSGLALCGFSLLLMISAASNRSSMAIGVICFVAGAGLGLFAFVNVHGSYTITEMPQILMSVVSRYLM